MRLHDMKANRYVERQIHFGVGKSVKTACGLTLFSRHIMVQLGDDFDGAMITDDLSRVTCKRCLASKDWRLRRLLDVEASCPGVFDRPTLCGEVWLLDHALSLSQGTVAAQNIEIHSGELSLTLTNAMKARDRKELLHNFVRQVKL